MLDEQGYQRKADAALMSWRAGDFLTDAQSGGATLALSSTAADIDLKEFLARRGKVIL